MKKMILNSLAALTALIMAFSLTACGNKDRGESPSEAPSDPNIPVNTVSHATEAEPVPKPSDITSQEFPVVPDAPETSPTEPESVVSDTSAMEEPETPTDTEAVDEPVSELNTKAMEYLKLLNSDKVHARMIVILSYGNDEIFSVAKEYYVDGDERIYVEENGKRMIRNGIVTCVDDYTQSYYSYEDDGEYGIAFGFEMSDYVLLSTDTDEEGVYSETYDIGGITSTWYFDGDRVRVADRNIAEGNYTLYNFEVIETSTEGMDFSIPEGYVEE